MNLPLAGRQQVGSDAARRMGERTGGEAARLAPPVPEDDGAAMQVEAVSGLLPEGAAPVAIPNLAAELTGLRVLVVDDEPVLRSTCCEVIARMGFLAVPAGSVPQAREQMLHQRPDLMLLDLKLPGGDGLELLKEIRERWPESGVVVMTAFATVRSAVQAMRVGAGDYLIKPFGVQELVSVLERAARRVHFDLESRRLRERLRTERGMGELIGRSPEMEKVYRIMSKVAFSAHPVLILGESGTGKELVARSIHAHGPSAGKPFVTVDCSALVPALIESELFGYVKGAFTGANRAKEGLLTAGNGGTVFLDEIAELPLDLQGKLLRALQEKEVRPVGASQAVPLSARVLAATGRDLAGMVGQGRFRRDLYFRLNVVNLKLPPLRERRMDIPVLAEFFLERNEEETGTAHSFSADAVRLMTEYDWPGNVRELQHAIERACALSSGPVLHMADLPTQLQDYRLHHREMTEADARQGPAAILTIADMEKHAILETIRQMNGDKLLAAKLLGIGKTTLYRKLKEYGIGDDPGEQ
jgi:two-component system response regulator HydG